LGSFTFYEGPPTANGQPGIHHVLARAFKDLIPRFKTMQGYLVERKAGWDTHGLPVELEVEKKLKISGKPEIEKYGIEKFNTECQKSVWQYKEEWEKLTERIGFWLDMENPYITYDKDYVETLWWIFKKIYDRGFLYQGYKVVPQCPRCGTALSSHEVAQGYKAITEPSVYIKFKVTKGNDLAASGDFILSWTTTPWTLPGNVALAVGIDFAYVKVSQKGQNYILAKELLDIIEGDYKIEKEFKGSALVGIEYEPLFAGAIPKDTPNYQNAFKVYKADFVTTADGTGIVHTAVMYGEDDYNLGAQVDLPKYHTVDENGYFLSSVAKWSGQFVKDKKVEEEITADLDLRGLLFKTEDYTHDYPFCWRCHTPLLYYAKDSWFIKMSALREQLIKENKKINWIPAHIKEGRFGEWLVQVKDWAISRERYWGTPLPIWQCSACKQIKVIGSYQELHQETKCPLILEKNFDPHRPFIDQYKLKCRCGAEMSRVPEVADCWFDSGSMPFAQHHYPFENKKKIESKEYYPADYIAEAIDQTRGWFYTLLAIGVLVERGTSYKNVICLGHINDKKGQKMSKHLGNAVDPWEVINKWGSDALRFHFFTVNQPGEPKNFDIKNVEAVVKKNFLILFNVLNFYEMYQQQSRNDFSIKGVKNILDRWILAKINLVIKKVTKGLDEYNIFSAARSLSEFINELSTWYLRRSRERFKGNDQKDKTQAVNTLGYCLLTLAKLLAPFTPFIAEELYQKIGKEKESVHLEDWPKADKFDEKIIKEMEDIRKVVELALAKRDEVGIKVRQPLQKLTIVRTPFSKEGEKLIKDEVNIKEIDYIEDKSLSVLGIKELDTNISKELKEEGFYRELVRTINQLRKEAKLTIKDKVIVYYQTDSVFIKDVINQFKTDLLKVTLSQDIIEGKKEKSKICRQVKLNRDDIWLGLQE